MKKKFIIKFRNWHRFWVKGTEEELKEKLSSFGVKFTDEESCEEESLGVHFNRCLHTSIRCMGYDKNLYNEITSKVLDVFKEYNAFNIGKNLVDGYDYRSISHFCDGRQIDYSGVTILVSYKGNGVRNYKKIEELNKEDFFACFEELTGNRIIKE